MGADAIALDGFLDEERVPGLHGSTARFRIVVSPTDERADEMVMPCTVTDPAIAAAVLQDLVPGDLLRVTGHVRAPRTPDEPMWLDVTTLEFLREAPAQSPEGVDDGELDFLTADAGDIYQRTGISVHVADCGLFERHGTYLLWHDGDVAVTSVWAHTGAWVGETDDADRIGDLIADYERRPADG